MSTGSAIAITGISCRVAGASTLESFFGNVLGGHDPFRHLPNSRFDPDIFANECPQGARQPALGALVEDFGLDWRTLRLPPAQVEHLHRVERLALAVMGDALGDAGVRTDAEPIERGCIWLAANTLGPDPWLDPMARIRRHELVEPLCAALDAVLPDRAGEVGALIERVSNMAAPPLEPDVLMISAAIIAGRASHLYDFRGGHMAIDTGMCSSLAAVSQAVRALQRGECDIALVCAAAPLITPSAVLSYAHRSQLAAERPRPFASDAAGTLLGDGAVALVLERDEDVPQKRVYATIEGISSAVAPERPDGAALADCVALASERALAQAGVAPDQIHRIESRANGIRALDHAEADGLARVYRLPAEDKAQAQLTSSVPCVGYLQAASGLLALAKAALSLHHKCWPGQAGVNVPFAAAASLNVSAATDRWTQDRRAAVSDAGPESVAYHAIVATARQPRPTRSRPARRSSEDELIAIVGAGVIAPGAVDTHTFWVNALARKEVVGNLPRSRWDADKLMGSSTEFARAFNPRLAATVQLPPGDPANPTRDPCVALALEASHQALSDAGHTQAACRGDRVQVVFGQIALRVSEVAAEKRVQYALLVALAGEVLREAGIAEREIAAVVAEAQSRFDRENARFSVGTQTAFSGFTTALLTAAKFGFSAEVLSLDAACASSLAAVKIGSDALRAGEADLALAGGVSFHLLPEYYVALGLLDALSTRAGHPFHRSADGFVPAEAAGAVVLKRLNDARRDNDRIYAVIKGHGVSSDGRGLSIYSANPRGQMQAMRRALSAAGVQADQIDLVEAHGPGAPLGDRAEINSIAAVYGERPFLPALSVASAKSLVGHSSSAGAMLSLIRAVKALDSKVLPPGAGDGDLAPDLPFGPTIELSRVTRAWPPMAGRPRRAAVNAFGMTGINHHVLLEEVSAAPFKSETPDAALDRPASRPARPLSARRFVLQQCPVSLPMRPATYPLQGRTLLLVPDRGTLWVEVEKLLLARGAQPLRLELDEPTSEAKLSQLLASRSVDGIVDLNVFGPSYPLESSGALWAELKRHSDRSYSMLRSLYERLANTLSARGCYVAVTSTQGGGAASKAALLGSFLQGFARSLKQELPHVLCKALDLDPLLPATKAAAFVIRELEDGNDRVDVRYTDRRLVTKLSRADHAEASPELRRLAPGDVFVFSGGGRGVVYQCAAALARLGVQVIVTGRRALPDASLAWVNMTEAEFSDFRRAELVRRRVSEGPAKVLRLLDDMELQRQAFANIRRARAAGLPLSYEICDITDLESVRSLTQAVRARYGRIDGVGHGAMIEHSAVIPRKAPQIIDATLSTKVLGLTNLLEATREDPLKWFIAFGSGVGRYGNSGQTDYAGANALVAALLNAHQLEHPKTHCVTMDWPAWESLGATANPDIADLLRNAGVTSISPEEGTYWFLSELALGEAEEVVICGERMLQSWPFLAVDADGQGDRALEVDDDGNVLLPSRWPMLDRITERASDRITVERRFSVDRDYYMPQHLLNGIPVLPATFGCETMAEAAKLLCPGYHVQEIRDFHVDAPFSMPRSQPNTAKITASIASSTTDQRTVECDVRSALSGKLAHCVPDRLHHGATVVLSSLPPGSLGTRQVPKRTEILHATSFYEPLVDPVKLGRLFGQARFIQVFGSEALGIIYAIELESMFADLSDPCFIASPLLIDAALQVAGSWDGYVNGFVSVPLGIASVLLGRPIARNERATVLTRVVTIEHPDVYYDIDIIGNNSEVLIKLRHVHLKRIGNPTVAQ